MLKTDRSTSRSHNAGVEGSSPSLATNLIKHLTSGCRGAAACELPMPSGFDFSQYLLCLDREAGGSVEAKADGTLTGVEA